MLEATRTVFLKKGGWMGIVILLGSLVWYAVTGGPNPEGCLVVTKYFSEVWYLLAFLVVALAVMSVVMCISEGDASISSIFLFVLVCLVFAAWNFLACECNWCR